ncbi:MAG: hypothetical protein ACKOBL_06780 [Chloroflexota bacterium]|jgi:hypothetical protein
MFRRKITLIVSFLLVAALSACNLPSGNATETEEPADLALTITALAGSPSAGETQETATPQFTSTAVTSTPSVPEVTVSQNTNCRTGPGVQYDNIGALLVTQKATVVGKNTSTGYWIINNPGKTGTCWLFPQYATVSGNTANLQEYSIPPTPTPSPTPTFTPTSTPSAPAPVTNVTMDMTCPNNLHSGTLKWEDKSNNEDGFNIYINNTLVASIPANSTSYVVVSAPNNPFLPGIASKFEVEAFNGAGKAAKVSVAKGCP